jgi:hypothetical protein
MGLTPGYSKCNWWKRSWSSARILRQPVIWLVVLLVGLRLHNMKFLPLPLYLSFLSFTIYTAPCLYRCLILWEWRQYYDNWVALLCVDFCAMPLDHSQLQTDRAGLLNDAVWTTAFACRTMGVWISSGNFIVLWRKRKWNIALWYRWGEVRRT